jgi:transposase
VDAADERPGYSTRQGAFAMIRKRYNKSFKDEACKLVTERKLEIGVAARDLGVAEQTLRYWLVQRGWSPQQVELPENDDPKWLKARVRDLEQRLHRAEMEREILKKATAFFASQHP